MYGLLPFLKDILMCTEQAGNYIYELKMWFLYETVEKHQMIIPETHTNTNILYT